ncbi:MAG: PilZ domain-containing protein, partial [Candidatus Eisenbacteria bacterium]|nr:PilZ domain-containing protein [Candidatus Eisenbacteria bacterium]
MPQKKAVRRRERRRMSRADAQLSMRVEGAGADSALASIVTESRNISGSGIYCLSPHYVAPLSKIAVTIVLPGLPGRMPRQRLLKCEGLVVRCQNQSAGAGRAFELACSFLGLEESSRQLLDEYVMWRNIEAMRHPAAGARRVRNGAARTNRTGSGGRAPAARATSGTAATRATTRRR